MRIKALSLVILCMYAPLFGATTEEFWEEKAIEKACWEVATSDIILGIAIISPGKKKDAYLAKYKSAIEKFKREYQIDILHSRL